MLARSANISWTLVGTAGENLASYREIREKYGGIIFVGDSQIREIAWAAMQMLTPGQPKLFHRQDKVFARLRPPGKSACVPQTIGKTGFTASCGRRAFGSKGELLKPGTEPEECSLHSPFKNKSHAEAMRPSSSAGRRGQGDEGGADAMRGSPCCCAEARLLVTMAIPEVF